MSINQLFHVRVSHYVFESALVAVRGSSAEAVHESRERLYLAVCEDPDCWEVSGDVMPQNEDVDVLDGAEAATIDPRVLRLLPVFGINEDTGEVNKETLDPKTALYAVVRRVIEDNHGRSLDDAQDRAALIDAFMKAL